MIKSTWEHDVGDLVATVDPPRQVASSVWWIPSCLTIKIQQTEYHVHNSCFVVLGSEKALVFDTGHPTCWEGVEHFLDELLAGRRLDYIVPSHPESPHSGNGDRLLAKFPDSVVVGDVRDYHLMYPEFTSRLRTFHEGEELDLGEETFVIVKAVLKDLPSSVWGYARQAKTLFTADAFAVAHYPPIDDDDRPVHAAGECAMLASEYGRVPEAEQVTWIVNAAFHWAKFVDVQTKLPEFDALRDEYPVELIAPAHGPVIDDMSVVPVIWKGIRLAFDPTLTIETPKISQSPRSHRAAGAGHGR